MHPSVDAPQLVIASRAMTELIALAARAAGSSAKVLITGESGVGKDLVARYVHSHSSRKQSPFVAVNCAGLTETLLESELFGHVKGSFTGAYRDKRGKLQLAHRGTLFLDEVGEMSLRMQALLLRFLENGEIQAVGSDQSEARVDVRVIAATNRNLGELVASRPVPRGPVVPAAGHPPPRAAASRAAGGHSGVDDALPRAGEATTDVHRRGASGVPAIPLAGQRPRAAERRRAAALAVAAPARSGSNISRCRCAREQPRSRRSPIAAARSRTSCTTRSSNRARRSGSHVYPMFLARDITRHDLRELVRRGLGESRGRYKALLKLFGMSTRDYRRFMNFLAAHECGIGVREFRSEAAAASSLKNGRALRRNGPRHRPRVSRTAAECRAAASSSAAWSGGGQAAPPRRSGRR